MSVQRLSDMMYAWVSVGRENILYIFVWSVSGFSNYRIKGGAISVFESLLPAVFYS